MKKRVQLHRKRSNNTAKKKSSSGSRKSKAKPEKKSKPRPKQPKLSFFRREERKLKHLEQEVKEEFFVHSHIHRGKYKIPLGIKLLIGYLSFLAILYIASFFYGITFPTSILFGKVVVGFRAIVINVVLVVLLFVMIYGFSMRKAFTFDLSLAWFGFAFLNALISVLLLESGEYMVFKGMLYISLITLIIVNSVIIWYVLHEKKYFYAEYFHERKVHHRDKVFVYTVVAFWVIALLIGITFGVDFYDRATSLVDSTIVEINEKQIFTQEICEPKQGEEKDICLLVISTYLKTQKNAGDEILAPICEGVQSEFYRFACFRSIER